MYSIPGFTPTTGVDRPRVADCVQVLIAGRDPLARAGLSSIVSALDDVAVLDTVAVDERFSSRLDVLAPEVLLFDAGSDLTAIPIPADIPTIVLVDDITASPEMIAAGARGVVARTATLAQLDAAIRAVREGLVVFDSEARRNRPSALAAEPLVEPLTSREIEVIRWLAVGLTNKEIAQRLGITDHTVKFHVNAILSKLGAATRTEAVVHAAKLGIVVL